MYIIITIMHTSIMTILRIIVCFQRRHSRLERQVAAGEASGRKSLIQSKGGVWQYMS